MNARVFNACLLIGWLMFVVGLGIVSLPAALGLGGLLLMLITLLLARWSGVQKPLDAANMRGADVH